MSFFLCCLCALPGSILAFVFGFRCGRQAQRDDEAYRARKNYIDRWAAGEEKP